MDEGDYKEEGNPPPALAGPCGYHGAYDRPGNYHIVVSRPGFLTKELNDVEVEKDGCHVDGRTLDVDLERDPNAPPELDAGADASTDGP